MADLKAISQEPLEDAQASCGNSISWDGDLSRDVPAGVAFQSVVYGGTGYATEGWVGAGGFGIRR